MKKFVIAFAVVAMSAGVFAADEKKSDKKADKPAAPAAQAAASDDPVVMRFGDVAIKKSEFEAAIKTLPQEYQALASGPAKKSFAEDYLRMKMLANQAEKAGLANDPEVKMQIELMRSNALANAQISKMQESIKLSDADVQKAYDEQKGMFEKAKARHILIAPEGSPAAPPDAKLTDEQAKAKAEEIRKKLVAGGDFAELAKKESHDKGSGERGGDLGEFGRGDMVPEFEKVAFEGKIGEISPVVKTQFGYHILQVSERKATPLADVRPQLEERLRQQKLQEQLEAIKKDMNVQLDETYFAQTGPAPLDPGFEQPAPDASQPTQPTPPPAPEKKPTDAAKQ